MSRNAQEVKEAKMVTDTKARRKGKGHNTKIKEISEQIKYNRRY
jgi:hypothetical protein